MYDPYVYDRERTAHHEAGHATARFCLWGTTGATDIQKHGSTWGSSDAQRLPSSLMTGPNVRLGPYTALEKRLLSKSIVCALAGSAAEARFLSLTSTTAFEIFETKADDQAFVWALAGRRWLAAPSIRDAMAERLMRVAERLIDRNGQRVDDVASTLVQRETLSPRDVLALM